MPLGAPSRRCIARAHYRNQMSLDNETSFVYFRHHDRLATPAARESSVSGRHSGKRVRRGEGAPAPLDGARRCPGPNARVRESRGRTIGELLAARGLALGYGESSEWRGTAPASWRAARRRVRDAGPDRPESRITLIGTPVDADGQEVRGAPSRAAHACAPATSGSTATSARIPHRRRRHCRPSHAATPLDG